LTGEPTPGATIQPLPAGELFPEAQSLPGINCDDCELPADAFDLTFVKPFDAN
jgi:ribose transport system substrate-binding protein